MPGSQCSDRDASQSLVEIVEIIEIVPDVPEQASAGDEPGDGPLTLSDLNVDGVNDALYQAFVATGLLRPR